nr:copia-type polyprotein [Tanacetum cinerariifolium]
QESKAYRLYDPSSKRIVISRDVILDEDATWDWSKEKHKAKELSIEDDEKVQGNQHEHENIEDLQNTPNTPQNSKIEAGSKCTGYSTRVIHSYTKTTYVVDDYYADQDQFNEDEASFAMYIFKFCEESNCSGYQTYEDHMREGHEQYQVYESHRKSHVFNSHMSRLNQEVVTLSTTEAEYVTATTCACHCVWLKDLLEELKEQAGTLEVMCDNSSTIKFVKEPDVVQQKFCRSEEQLADLMTRPLKLSIFEFIRGEIKVPAIKQAT